MTLSLIARIPEYDMNDPSVQGLYDATHNIASRAESVILLLQNLYLSDERDTLNPSVMFNALESVTKDLGDIRHLMEHYEKSVYAKRENEEK